MKAKLELNVGDIIKIGPKCSKICGFKTGEIITLVEGYFEHYNGLYDETQTAPSLWDESTGEFDSIYHLFGNDLEDFKDSKVIGKVAEDFCMYEIDTYHFTNLA